MTSEDELLAAIMDTLALRGATTHDAIAQHARRLDLAQLMGDAGAPDIIGVVGRTLIAWELKDARGRLDMAQAGWIAKLQNVDSIDVRIVRPADQDAIVRELLGHRIVGARMVRQVVR